MNTLKKQGILIFADMLIAAFSVVAAFWLYFQGNIADSGYSATQICIQTLIAMGSITIFGYLCGTYRSMWEYIGFSELLRQGVTTALSGCVFLIIKYLIDTGRVLAVSGVISFIYCCIVFLLCSGVRGVPRLLKTLSARRGRTGEQRHRAVIIGAGASGAMIIKQLSDDNDTDIRPVAAVDDDPDKRGMYIAGVKVCGGLDDLEEIARTHGADLAIIAVPSATTAVKRSIYEKCQKAGLKARILQNVVDMEKFLAGNVNVLKEVSLEDLLFRESIQPDMMPVYKMLDGKVVLVTGGAGSIGSEICRQVLQHGCEKLIVFDFSENGLFAIGEELKTKADPSRYVLCLGSIRDMARLRGVFAQYHPDIVYHAAAHKHVPMMEINPFEAVKNNVFGTENVIKCCGEFKAQKFVLISTDKAVNPTNVMGATKRLAELILQTNNGLGGCEMACVRFGNVLGSNGSVIPTFKRQIAAGGPVTVTHPEMKRYFMMIPEAVSLVLFAGALAHGGEVFVLDMGKPIKIYDLAVDLIRLAGYEPDRDIKIEFTGTRPGEKLFEELSLNNEQVDATTHEKIFVMHSGSIDRAALERTLGELQNTIIASKDEAQLRRLVFDTVDTYNK